MPAFARADVAVTQLGAGWRQSLALTQLNELYAWGRTSAVAATAAAGAGGALLAASGAPLPPGGARGSVNPVTSPIKRTGSKPPIKGRTASDVADDVTSVISTMPMAVAMPTRLWRCPQTLHVESSHSMCAVAVTFAQPSADDVTGSLSSMLFAQQQRSALLDHADALACFGIQAARPQRRSVESSRNLGHTVGGVVAQLVIGCDAASPHVRSR